MIIIDTFSKQLWARGFKTKTAEEITKTVADILAHTKRCPRNLQPDQGTEFFNSKFQRLITHNINIHQQ